MPVASAATVVVLGPLPRPAQLVQGGDSTLLLGPAAPLLVGALRRGVPATHAPRAGRRPESAPTLAVPGPPRAAAASVLRGRPLALALATAAHPAAVLVDTLAQDWAQVGGRVAAASVDGREVKRLQRHGVDVACTQHSTAGGIAGMELRMSSAGRHQQT